jgi:hypothetical protein
LPLPSALPLPFVLLRVCGGESTCFPSVFAALLGEGVIVTFGWLSPESDFISPDVCSEILRADCILLDVIFLRSCVGGWVVFRQLDGSSRRYPLGLDSWFWFVVCGMREMQKQVDDMVYTQLKSTRGKGTPRSIDKGNNENQESNCQRRTIALCHH